MYATLHRAIKRASKDPSLSNAQRGLLAASCILTLPYYTNMNFDSTLGRSILAELAKSLWEFTNFHIRPCGPVLREPPRHVLDNPAKNKSCASHTRFR